MSVKHSLLEGIDLNAIRETLQAPAKSDPRDFVALRLPLDKIESDPHQPRRQMNAGGDGQEACGQSLEELAESILQHGVLQPINVEAVDDGRYRIVSGERRWRASRIARDSGRSCAREGYDLTRIPAVIVSALDEHRRLEMQLVENIAREDMRREDVAAALQTLMDTQGLSRTEIARRLGRSRPWVTRMLALGGAEAQEVSRHIGVDAEQIGTNAMLRLLDWQKDPEKANWLDAIAQAIRGETPFSSALMEDIEERFTRPAPTLPEPAAPGGAVQAEPAGVGPVHSGTAEAMQRDSNGAGDQREPEDQDGEGEDPDLHDDIRAGHAGTIDAPPNRVSDMVSGRGMDSADEDDGPAGPAGIVDGGLAGGGPHLAGGGPHLGDGTDSLGGGGNAVG
ncbi:ParB/RepB/Spo0J family partition protein, partial [Acidithiobacillus sp.]|uniref:ParB/RepB/Spo0J family partition protein n=1 Tax=Acidithiobacillus sp. TaxID=1872118 RepID=UPI003CFEA842